MFKAARDYLNKIRWFDSFYITFVKNKNLTSKIFFLINFLFSLGFFALNFIYKYLFVNFYIVVDKILSLGQQKDKYIIKESKACFILGNGPSLMKKDLLKLKKKMYLFVIILQCASRILNLNLNTI